MLMMIVLVEAVVIVIVVGIIVLVSDAVPKENYVSLYPVVTWVLNQTGSRMPEVWKGIHPL